MVLFTTNSNTINMTETYKAKQEYRWDEILQKTMPIEVIYVPEHGAYYACYIEKPKELHLLHSDSPGHPCFEWTEMVKQLALTRCEGELIDRFIVMRTLIKNVEQDYINRSNSPDIMKLFLDKLNRDNFIQVVRSVREEITCVWTKDVALSFGAVLKELKR